MIGLYRFELSFGCCHYFCLHPFCSLMFRDMLSTALGIKYTPSGDSQISLSNINASHDYRTRTSYTPQPCNGRSASVKRALTKPFASTSTNTNLLAHTLQGTLGKIIRMESRLSQSYGDFGKEIGLWNKVLCQSHNADMVNKMVLLMQTSEDIHMLLAAEIEKLKNSFGNIYEREKKLMDKISQSKKNLAHFEDLTKKIGRNAAKTNLAYESLEEDAENIRVLENQLAVSLSTDLKDAILSYLVRVQVTSSQLNSMVNEYQNVLLGVVPGQQVSDKPIQENFITAMVGGQNPIPRNVTQFQQNHFVEVSPDDKLKSDGEGFQTPLEYAEREELVRGKEMANGLLPTPTSRFSETSGGAGDPIVQGIPSKGRRLMTTFSLYQPREPWG